MSTILTTRERSEVQPILCGGSCTFSRVDLSHRTRLGESGSAGWIFLCRAMCTADLVARAHVARSPAVYLYLPCFIVFVHIQTATSSFPRKTNSYRLTIALSFCSFDPVTTKLYPISLFVLHKFVQHSTYRSSQGITLRLQLTSTQCIPLRGNFLLFSVD